MYRKAGYIEEIPHIFICAGVSNGGKDSCEVSLKKHIALLFFSFIFFVFFFFAS